MKDTMKKLTQQRLKDLLRYDVDSGEFFWLVKPSPKSESNVGDRAGVLDKRTGARGVRLDGLLYQDTALAWLYVHGELPTTRIYKIDGPSNAIINLRLGGALQNTELTQERLKAVLDYNAESGVFIWKLRLSNNIPAGREAGVVKASAVRVSGAQISYRYIRIDGNEYHAQRLAWFYVHGRWPRRIEFVDGNGINTRLSNLTESDFVSYEFDGSTKYDVNAYNRHRRTVAPHVFRNQDLKKSFGIDLARYQEMFLAQAGVCAICECAETSTAKTGQVKWLAVDHDHATGEIRGLLCEACNTAIGKFKDDPDLLRRAARYLERQAKPDNILTLVGSKETSK